MSVWYGMACTKKTDEPRVCPSLLGTHMSDTPVTPLSLMDFIKAAKAQITEIDGARLQALRKDRQDLLIVDVREPQEYAAGCIADAEPIPRGVLEPAADLAYSQHNPILAQARGRPVVLYCATGGRSAMAAATLQLMGFQEVYSLAGGYTRWLVEHRPATSST